MEGYVFYSSYSDYCRAEQKRVKVRIDYIFRCMILIRCEIYDSSLLTKSSKDHRIGEVRLFLFS